MKMIKFAKEPGFTYDLIHLFVYAYNKYRAPSTDDEEKREKNTAYYSALIEEFSPFSGELLPFFLLKDNNRCFMALKYYDAFIDEYTTDLSLSVIQKALKDYDRVVENLLRFYFDEITAEEIAQYHRSPASINSKIKESGYSDAVKNCLYDLFLDPIPKIQLLSHELMEKEFRLARYYETHHARLTEVEKAFDLEEIELLLKTGRSDVDISTCKQVIVTFCMAVKDHIRVFFSEDYAILSLGLDYRENFLYLRNKRYIPDLSMLGSVLSEKNRVEILNLLLRRGELTLREIENALNITPQNAYYHITLMTKADMLKFRNQGRTILYSVNKPYFTALSEALRQYGEE